MYTIEALPPEILEKIFERLDVACLLNCASVCRRWRSIFVRMTCPTVGYIPKIMSRIFTHLDKPTVLAMREACSLWKNGLDILTAKNIIRINGQTVLTNNQVNQLAPIRQRTKWEGVNHNPFPSRIVRIPLTPDERGFDVDGVIKNLTKYGHHVHFLNLKIYSSVIQRLRVKISKWDIVKIVLRILPLVENIQGLSIFITSEFHTISRSESSPKEEVELVQLSLNKLKAIRIVSWIFRSEEMEWLYYKILKSSPCLEFFDPDFHMGYYKFSTLQSYAFLQKLKCLKIAIPAIAITEFCRSLKRIRGPLEILHLDVFEHNRVDPNYCVEMLENVIGSCGKGLTTLSLSFYEKSKFVPCSEKKRIPSYFSGILSSLLGHQRDSSHSFYRRFWQSSRASSSTGCFEMTTSNIKNLRLRGINGDLNFLRKFKKVERLILLDYEPGDQSLFVGVNEFYTYLPSLKELCIPYFESTEEVYDQKSLLRKIAFESEVVRYIYPLCF